MLREAGFPAARIVGPTGYATSRATAAHIIVA